MIKYIYHNKEWPGFFWNNDALLRLLTEVRHFQGKLIGRMESLGFDLRAEAFLESMSLEVIKSNEIEGEFLNPDQVRSSIARRLGIDHFGLVRPDRNVEGMVDLLMDAIQNFDAPLSAERLFDWHSGLFPTGRKGIKKIIVGAWRNDSTGPMQVVSGPMGKEKIHYQAPDASLIENEMKRFIDWFNKETPAEPVIKAGIAHLWFVTIHPFEDGNGRIARALTDMLLARADRSPQRFYSMSSQIQAERKFYYNILEATQRGDMDVTSWLSWFLKCLLNALVATENNLASVIFKAGFWQKHSQTIINERQKLIINRLLDGFKGKLTSSKWAKMAKCSSDTALRDIQDLITKNILVKEPSGGRSTNYILKPK